MWTKFRSLALIAFILVILRALGLASPEYSGNITAGPEF